MRTSYTTEATVINTQSGLIVFANSYAPSIGTCIRNKTNLENGVDLEKKKKSTIGRALE